MFDRFRSLLASLLRRSRFEGDMREELQTHLDEHAQELMRSGLSREEAWRQARLAFGGINSVEEDCRKSVGLVFFDTVRREFQHCLRLLARTPAFTVTTLLILAFCIGANLTIFAAVDAILLRPLPFPDADRLLTIYNTYPKAGVNRDGSSLTNYYERRGQIPGLESISLYRDDSAIVSGAGGTERVGLMRVSADFFSTLQTAPAIGRSFTRAESDGQEDPIAIVSDAYWRKHLRADPKVLGRTIRVDSFSKTIVGVLPAGYRFLSSEAQVYLPLISRPEARTPVQRHSGGNFIQMIARLKPNASVGQVQSQIDEQNTRLERDDPQGKQMAAAGFRSLVVPLRSDHVASVRPTLFLLQGGVLLLLIIGAVNLANLFLVRAGTRSKDLALRRALGATRAHVIAQVLSETLALTSVGSLLGLLVAAGGVRLLVWLGADHLPLGTSIRLTGTTIWIALVGAAALGATLAFPVAWFHLRTPVQDALKSESRTGTRDHRAYSLRYSFIVVQIALAFTLLAGAGLLSASLRRVAAISPGFQPGRTVSAQLSLIGNKYPTPLSGLLLLERWTAAVELQPGVSAAGVTTNLPFSGNSGKSAATVQGYVLKPGESPRGHYSYGVAGDYFRAMGFALIEGRFLDGSDSRRPERMCVVDVDFAQHYWPGSSPLGRHLWQGSPAGKEDEAFTVVGVIHNAKQAGLTEDSGQGAVYYPFIHQLSARLYLVARSRTALGPVAFAMQQAAQSIDPELAVIDSKPMDVRIADSLLVRRSPALLAALFSALALLLTATGLYGVLSYILAQRRREIAVRMALGARPGQIGEHYVTFTGQIVAGGVILGFCAIWAMSTALQTLLFQVPALDWQTLAEAAMVIAVVAVLGCLLPVIRAVRTSPTEALGEN